MLVPNQMIEMQWTRNKSYYINLGYEYTGFRNYFMVHVEDLPPQSKKKVKVICDNCGKEKIMTWKDYLRYHSEKFGDLCFECTQIKREDTNIKKYGVSNPSQVKEFQDKRTQTIRKNFGVDNAFQSDVCKQKSKDTCVVKYGYEYACQAPEVIEKTKITNRKRYGYDSPRQSPRVKQKIIQTNLQRYGVPYTLSVPKVRAKGRETLYRNGKVPSSTPERKTCELLKEIYGEENCIAQFPYDQLSFDCLLCIDRDKIDVEYDGWFWHKNKQKEDNRRNRFLISRGFKVLRIKGNYGIPTEEQIIKSIDYLVKGNHKYSEIILDI